MNDHWRDLEDWRLFAYGWFLHQRLAWQQSRSRPLFLLSTPIYGRLKLGSICSTKRKARFWRAKRLDSRRETW